MKLKKLVIYGFGQHEALTIPLGPGVNVFYGANESGKTTIQQFILQIFFGFPHKNSSYMRYEPRGGGKYGGQIHLRDEHYGDLIIERVRGKSAGEVKVYFEDGQIGNELDLQRILNGYDRNSFESIFAFSLFQLQGFEKMNEQDLSRTLLASGTTGVDHLLTLEKKMLKEMEVLYKKQGRIPAINQQARALRELEQALHKEAEALERYAPAMARLTEVEQEVSQLMEAKEAAELNLRTLQFERQQLPLHQRKHALQLQLNTLKDVQFPVDGLQRYDALVHKIDETKAQLMRIETSLATILQKDDRQMNREKLQALEHILSQESAWHRSLTRLHTLKTEVQQMTERMQQLKGLLGMSQAGDIEQLRKVDVSIQKEEELFALIEDAEDLYQEVNRLEKEKKLLQSDLAKMESDELETWQPSKEEIREAEEWPEKERDITEAKAYLSLTQNQRQQFARISWILLAIGLGLGLYSVFSKQYVFGIFAVVLLLLAWTLTAKNKTRQTTKAMEQLVAEGAQQEEKMRILLQKIAAYEETKTWQEKRRRESALLLQNIDNTFISTVASLEKAEQRLQSFLSTYLVEEAHSSRVLPELFRMIRELQALMLKIDAHEKELARYQQQIDAHLAQSEELLQQKIPIEAHYEWVRKEYTACATEFQQAQSLQKEKKQLLAQKREKEAMLQLLQRQKQALFEQAKVDHAEDYFQAHQRMQEKEEVTKELTHLFNQLEGQAAISSSKTKEEYDRIIEEIEQRLKEIHQQQASRLDEKARLTNETTSLLTDENYSVKQQEFEIARAKFNDLARQWAVKQALTSAIQEMMDALREEQFPKVLAEASRLFSHLTNGKYARIVLTGEGYFEVVTVKGSHFPMIELSQATKEQAYLSLRFALAGSLEKEAPFPFLLDDPFVHFDKNRLSNTIEVIEQLPRHQFLYFTCQPPMKIGWTCANMIDVSSIENEKGANV